MKPSFTRSSFVRKRRSTKPGSAATPGAGQKAGPVYRTAARLLPVEPRRLPARGSHPGSRRSSERGRRDAHGRSYDIAFNVGRSSVRAPSISLALPELGARWVSGALAALMVFVMVSLWNSNAFTVGAAELQGAERLTGSEVDAAIGLLGEPVFKVEPQEIARVLRSAYPDLSWVRVRVIFPNRIRVEVVERAPVLVWRVGDMEMWIDRNGVAFPARGDPAGLIRVAAEQAPPAVAGAEALPVYERPYLDPAMVEAMLVLAPYVPADLTMTYDPTYGMGWQDPKGWFVYFGQNTQDIPMKLVIYQAVAEAISLQGIQARLVSVEYLDAPFYK